MLEGGIVKNLFLFALPIILTGILQNFYNTADTIVVGNFGGKDALAAVGATASITGLIVNVVVSIFVGMNVVLARQIGASDNENARITSGTGYVTSLALGVIVMIIGEVCALPLLHVTNCPDSVIGGAAVYLQIYFLGMPATLFNNYAASVIRMNGDSRSPFIYFTTSGIVNVVFNLLFVLVFGNPVVGVAIATVLSMYVASVQFFIHLCKKLEGPCKLEPFKLTFSFSTFLKIVRYGIPSCISSATFSLTNLMITPQINAYGEIGMSGSAASSSVEAFLYSITGGFNIAVVSFMGQNIGAGNRKRTVEVLKKSYVLLIAIMAVYTALIIGFGKEILWIFIPGEVEAIEFAQLRLTFIVAGAVLNAVMNVNAAAMQAYGYTVAQMISNLIGVCLFRVIWMLVIYPLNVTPWMLWLCYPVSWVITAATVFVIVIVLTKKYIKGKDFAL